MRKRILLTKLISSYRARRLRQRLLEIVCSPEACPSAILGAAYGAIGGHHRSIVATANKLVKQAGMNT